MAGGFALRVPLWIWRHPAPRRQATLGRCVGRLDVAAEPRRTKRLARRVLQAVRREGLPRVVWTSPLARCADVGRCLRRLGFEHRIDADLLELDFGRWEGRRWSAIARADVEAWERDFMHHAPGGGEALASLFARVERFVARLDAPAIVVGHAGWITAAAWRAAGRGTPTASDWPVPAGCGELTRLQGASCLAAPGGE